MIDVLSASVGGVLSACDAAVGRGSGHGASRFVTSGDLEVSSRRRFDTDRRRTLAGRAALRLLASVRLGGGFSDAADLPIDRTCAICGAPHGRPRLPEASLSSSTSGDHVLVAVGAADENLGVDVQDVPRMLWREFDSDVLQPAERSSMSNGESGREERIVSWSMKEAALKAMGTGLRVSPSTVRVETEASEIGRCLWRRMRSNMPAHRILWATSFSPSLPAHGAVVSDSPRGLRTWSVSDGGLSHDHPFLGDRH